jgi:hypothetical protein
MKTPPIEAASVKVMRSYDYCHFEVTLSSTQVESTADVDALRKEAARLADKAVSQYKIAKAAHARYEAIREPWRLERALKTPEGERDPEEKAVIKYHQDAAFAARFDYDYQDEWDNRLEDL